MCKITYDNLTICIGFHEDLCVHVEQQQPKKSEADSLSGELRRRKKFKSPSHFMAPFLRSEVPLKYYSKLKLAQRFVE